MEIQPAGAGALLVPAPLVTVRPIPYDAGYCALS